MSRGEDCEAGDISVKSNAQSGAGHREQQLDHDLVGVTRNEKARFRNPLVNVGRAELRAQVASFCREVGFQEDKHDVFYRGALAAQNPTCYDDNDDLTREDKRYLSREVIHKWHLPKALYCSIALCSLGAAIQGWDNTGANGANLSFPREFGIENDVFLVGFINSGPTLFGLASAWAADPVNNLLGRRGTIFLTGLFCVFPVLAQGLIRSWQGLLICRLFMGLGMGIKISTIPVYSAEIAPASIRGGMVTSFQLWVAFGILVGFCSNLVWYRIGDLAWRFQLASAFAPAIPVLVFVWFCPESPRWLMKKGRYREAFAAFCRIRNDEMMAARDLYYAHCQVTEEHHDAYAGQTLFRRVADLATVPRLRRATIASAWIVTSQQFSGINIMAFYSSTIFQQAGYTTKQCLLASIGYGLVMFVFALPAIRMSDTFGRRNLLLFTFPNMACCLLVAGFCFKISPDNECKVPLIATFIYLFTAFYGPGIGPLPSIYFSEAFPLSHREIGSAFTVCVNNAVGSALTLTFPLLLSKLGPTGAFSFYAGLNSLAFVVIFFLVPETKQRTLEELDHIFGIPMRQHVAYQGRVWLPWFLKRHVLLRKEAKLEPLYGLRE